MASYGYIALDSTGKEVKGSMEAESEAAVQDALRQKGMSLLDVTKQSVLTKDLNIEIGGKVKPRDLSVFCRQFVSMNRAGVTIIESISMLAEQTENTQLQKALFGVKTALETGSGMADAMENYPKVFPELMINTVRAGEASGSLDISFERLATQYEKSARTQAKVKKAFIYPIIVCIVAVAVVIVMLVVIIPKYTEMFTELGTDLPGITLAVKAMSDFLRDYWFILLPVVIAVVVVLKMYSKTYSGKIVFGKLQLKLPLFGPLATKSASSLLARTMSTLLSAGVPLEEALEVSAKVMPNVHFKNALLEARTQVLQGVPMSKPLEECGLFPPMVYHMVKIGEESGSTEDMLTKIADYFDEEVEMATESLMAAMEPMIIIFLALIVGTLVASCIAPMISMYGALNNL